jgi:hypothetical protein
VTEKKYTSQNTGQEITPAAFIAEMMCYRKCVSESTTLAFKYWNTDKWKAHFKSQITKAQQLCKKYGDVVVIRALKKNPRLWSLRVATFEKSVQKEQKLYEEELKSRTETDLKPTTDGKTMPSMPNGKNLFGEI